MIGKYTAYEKSHFFKSFTHLTEASPWPSDNCTKANQRQPVAIPQVKLINMMYACPSGDCDWVGWGWTFSDGASVDFIGRLVLVGVVLVVRVPLLGQWSPGHHWGVFSLCVVSSSAAFLEPLSTQVDDLTKSEEDAHKARHHHEKGEYFFLCGSKEIQETERG